MEHRWYLIFFRAVENKSKENDLTYGLISWITDEIWRTVANGSVSEELSAKPFHPGRVLQLFTNAEHNLTYYEIIFHGV